MHWDIIYCTVPTVQNITGLYMLLRTASQSNAKLMPQNPPTFYKHTAKKISPNLRIACQQTFLRADAQVALDVTASLLSLNPYHQYSLIQSKLYRTALRLIEIVCLIKIHLQLISFPSRLLSCSHRPFRAPPALAENACRYLLCPLLHSFYFRWRTA